MKTCSIYQYARGIRYEYVLVRCPYHIIASQAPSHASQSKDEKTQDRRQQHQQQNAHGASGGGFGTVWHLSTRYDTNQNQELRGVTLQRMIRELKRAMVKEGFIPDFSANRGNRGNRPAAGARECSSLPQN